MAAPKKIATTEVAHSASVADVADVAATAPTPAFKFAIVDGVPFPGKRTRGKTESAYPFAALAVNQSFFVTATEQIAAPWKTMSSLCSRFSRELHPKQFKSARCKNGQGQDGVGIWRVADTTEALKPVVARPRKPKTPDVPPPVPAAQPLFN